VRLRDAVSDRHDDEEPLPLSCVCFITAGPMTKLFALGEEESGGQVL
jgi:hypothetical protein